MTSERPAGGDEAALAVSEAREGIFDAANAWRHSPRGIDREAVVFNAIDDFEAAVRADERAAVQAETAAKIDGVEIAWISNYIRTVPEVFAALRALAPEQTR